MYACVNVYVFLSISVCTYVSLLPSINLTRFNFLHNKSFFFSFRQMVLHGLVNWNYEYEKDKKTVKRHEKKNEKKAFYEMNKEVISCI